MNASLLSRLERRPLLWLALYGLLIPATQMRFGLGALAWVAPAPLIHFLRLRPGWRAGAGALLAGMMAWTVATLSIVTAPLPAVLAPAFGVPIGLALTLPYLATNLVRVRWGERAAVLAFACLGSFAEWTLHTLAPLGTWGSAANTQLDDLALLQLASVTGLHGVSFLVYVVAGELESVLSSPRQTRSLALVVTLVAGVSTLGQLRLLRFDATGDETVRVAAIDTPSDVGRGPLPSAHEVAAVDRVLHARTREAARAGAELVVWTEAATMVLPEDEPQFLADLHQLAREASARLVAGYVVPISSAPLRYRNRYAYVSPAGVDHVYDKHEPVPGEPAVRGTGPMPLVVDPVLGRVSGAICYDYDFPRLARRHAQLDVDLVALPSSDWRGIDPLHTQMASLRAIEGGHSLIRSTRFGLSAGYDPLGRPRAWQSHFDRPAGDHGGVLLMNLPRHGLSTVYGRLGDWFPLLSALIGFGLLATARGGYPRAPWIRSSPSPAAPPSTRAPDSGWTPKRSCTPPGSSEPR